MTGPKVSPNGGYFPLRGNREDFARPLGSTDLVKTRNETKKLYQTIGILIVILVTVGAFRGAVMIEDLKRPVVAVDLPSTREDLFGNSDKKRGVLCPSIPSTVGSS